VRTALSSVRHPGGDVLGRARSVPGGFQDVASAEFGGTCAWWELQNADFDGTGAWSGIKNAPRNVSGLIPEQKKSAPNAGDAFRDMKNADSNGTGARWGLKNAFLTCAPAFAEMRKRFADILERSPDTEKAALKARWLLPSRGQSFHTK
jgi:hypothetical protein